MNNNTKELSHFIKDAIIEDLRTGRFSYIKTRYPPEPNGWLHLGHAKALALDFGLAKEFGGLCNLRFDDTNPEKEDIHYVEAIKADIKWLGFDWQDREFYASDYFEKLYEFAIVLIKKGNAYVDDLNEEEIKIYRGTNFSDKNKIALTLPGKDSPWRTRSIEENLELFAKMRDGFFPDGAKTLRAKIDMTHPNLVMRDPVMYRIRRQNHFRTGNKWCIYPLYDFQHPLSDALEGITHSLCSMEYEIHRPLYNWFIEQVGIFPSRQIEFARLNLSHTVMSKRLLSILVRDKKVMGWDDPRMPTLAGLRRRGYTASSIKTFVEKIGITKSESIIDIKLLEHCIREELNKIAQRFMVVKNPLKVIIDNWPDAHYESIEAINNPEMKEMGTRKITLGKIIYIEQEDFEENPSAKFYRLSPGKQVRLRYGYVITCTSFVKNSTTGKIEELHCEYDPSTKSGGTKSAIVSNTKAVKSTIHWVGAESAIPIELRIYDNLFTIENPNGVDNNWLDYLNSQSLCTITSAVAEPLLAKSKPGDVFQFERIGYFICDPDTNKDKIICNRTVSLKDPWSRIVAGSNQK